jgi:dTDP-glucose 4,6-dehydratase
MTVLTAAMEHDVKRYVHISTDEVYGSVERGLSVETDRLSPRNPYSASKVAAEAMIQSWATTYGYRVMMTRTGNNYGPWQPPDKAMPKFITQVLGGLPITIHGSGSNMRDWVHVRDNCTAIFNVLLNGELSGIYNISGRNHISNLDLAKLIIRHLGKGEIIHIDDRPGNDLRYAIDDDKIRRDLNWRPEISFEQGLKSTIEWYISHRDWWTKILEELK